MNNSLAEVHPELFSEWSDRNYPLLPTQVTVLPIVRLGGNVKSVATNGIRLKTSEFKGLDDYFKAQ